MKVADPVGSGAVIGGWVPEDATLPSPRLAHFVPGIWPWMEFAPVGRVQ